MAAASSFAPGRSAPPWSAPSLRDTATATPPARTTATSAATARTTSRSSSRSLGAAAGAAGSAELATDGLEVGRQRGGEGDRLARRRMRERQLEGVQEGPGAGQRGPDAAVAGVTEHRVGDGGQVHPDLVGATGLQPALDQRRG